MMHTGDLHAKQIETAGLDVSEASKVLILVHGRGAGTADILSLSRYLPVQDFALLAPAAAGNSWYPYSFLEPRVRNEPWLSSALSVLEDTVSDLMAEMPSSHIYFLGFSQGACLTLEYAARHARKYGGIAAFTGGLIGDHIDTSAYHGNFDHTPVFIGCSDPDPHVPVERVHASARVLDNMGADVTEKIYPGMGHTINPDEINQVKRLIFTPPSEDGTGPAGRNAAVK
jgi:phospholipase/carboxylesterase